MGPGAENLTGVYENTHIHDAMLEAMLGTSTPSASASASATSSASAQPMPDTGGPGSGTAWLALPLAALLGLAVLTLLVVARRPT